MAWWDQYFGDDNRGEVPVDRLSFDTSNPRFTPDKQPQNTSDAAIIEYLDRTADLAELIQSIASSGYIDIEPMIVTPRDDKLVVLEGNRRLAALKALSSSELAAEANVSIPDVAQGVRATFEHVAAFKVAAMDEARTLIGFKHINGPQVWDAYAKARFAARWLDEEVAKGEAGISLTDIANRMGDKHDTLYRIVSALYVLEQAEELGLFSVSDRAKKNFSFSHLYTALTYTEYREFIGLPRADRSENPPRSPVDSDHLDNLRRLLLWLYGSKSQGVAPAIRTQAPDLSQLKQVLGHPMARRAMMERNDLREALTYTIEGSDRFSKALFDAHAALRKAVAEITNADNDEETLGVADDVVKISRFIYTSLVSASDGTKPSVGDKEA